MNFLSVCALVIIFILWVGGKFKTTGYKAESKQRAIEKGKTYYWDDKGRQYSVRTGEEVVDYTAFNVWDPKEKRLRDRNGIRNAKTLKHVDWTSDFYDWKD